MSSATVTTCRTPTAAARAIAGIVPGLDIKKLTRQLASDREFVWVARKLDPPVAAAVRRSRVLAR